MQLQGKVAGLQGQTPAWRDSRAGARELVCRAADKDAGRGGSRRPPASPPALK